MKFYKARGQWRQQNAGHQARRVAYKDARPQRQVKAIGDLADHRPQSSSKQGDQDKFSELFLLNPGIQVDACGDADHVVEILSEHGEAANREHRRNDIAVHVGSGFSGYQDGQKHHQTAVEKGTANVGDLHVIREQDAAGGQDFPHAGHNFHRGIEEKA